MKYYISYERDKQRRPVGTRVILYDPETNDASFGMAVCGKHDHPNKKVGKSIAFGRAWKALNRVGDKPLVDLAKHKKRVFLRKAEIDGPKPLSFLTEKEKQWLQKNERTTTS